MFSGLVQGTGTISSVRPCAHSRAIEVRCNLADRDRIVGASIAVSGVCLTVTQTLAHGFCADVAFETLRKTKFGELAVGDRVNLEPALRLGDALGGHLVSGHVDGLANFARAQARGEARECWFTAPRDLLPYIAAKGSICLDGVSLTVNDVQEDAFMVGLVPHTLAATTLAELALGQMVHLEVDVLARYVVRWLSARESAGKKVDWSTLVRAGFIADENEH